MNEIFKEIVSEKEESQFLKYYEILSLWNKKSNLVQKNTISSFFDRHVLNSLELLPFIKKEQKIVDVGSGAGFPGVPLSIMGYADISLIESIKKKCSFLSFVRP